MLAWHVIIAKPNQDHLAAKGLREQGYADVYLPKTFEKRRTDKGSKPVGSLLLSPYLFVRLDAKKSEHGPIKNTRGVHAILCDAKKSEPIPLHNGDELISRMRQAEEEEFGAATTTGRLIRTDLKRGILVRIDKPGLLTRDADGKAVPIEGKIILIERRKVVVLAGASEWRVDEADVTVLA